MKVDLSAGARLETPNRSRRALTALICGFEGRLRNCGYGDWRGHISRKTLCFRQDGTPRSHSKVAASVCLSVPVEK